MYGTPYGVVLHPFFSPIGLPCKRPPWGFMAGIDLKTMKIAWMRPDGREASGTAQGKRTDLGPDRTQVDRCSATNRRHQSAACASGLIHTIS